MTELRETIRTVLIEGTTFNFGQGDIGLLQETVINRLTTELTDAVLDAAMFHALTGPVCACEWVRVEDDDRAARMVRYPTGNCDVHAGERL